MIKNFRAPAYPLITVDPFFSVWSVSDYLEETYTRHWTGRPAPIAIALKSEDRLFKICGFTKHGISVETENRLFQTELEISALSTVYTFENDFLKAKIRFLTPLLLSRTDIMSRPVSYIEYETERKDGKEGDIDFIFGISSECCVDDFESKVAFENTGYSLRVGNTVQAPLSASGDHTLPHWGYLHLCDENAYAGEMPEDYVFGNDIKKLPEDKSYTAYTEKPYLMVTKSENKGVITLAYEASEAIEYFGKKLPEYYTKYFSSFGKMIEAAKKEYPEIKMLCEKFDEEFEKEASSYGEDYKSIVTLAYRQAVGSHKLTQDEDKNILFFSKECHSNGCLGTMDITYPSIPLFLKYNPELVLGMLRPIIKYAQSDEWKYEFAPHDVGQYPLANGQFYGMTLDKQMPVEESGNMLICVACYTKYSKNNKFFNENKEILKKWADYLLSFGYDPGEQLCTDDFAGHLSHNCNLSIKAILGIAAYGYLSGDDSYVEKARENAIKWQNEAINSDGTSLTFDNKNSWSLKYNIIWDNILGYNLFDEEIKKKETELYLTKFQRYGVPLDSRKDYAKLDWLMWSTCIYNNEEYFNKVCKSIVLMLNETIDRVPMTDWYCTKKGVHHYFQNRTVVGGLFINMLLND